ncbi:MAG TPA: heparan-alpha-glucosaminide N-acetyltransferase domain-containing protein [Bryobacteraceae bacterium]|jgi:uncharacterized membrane protein|nr:heparan-alpha-glucosaminide N-acetyltransferase domain-containing protein [Bryobacteraceae bacterium]
MAELQQQKKSVGRLAFIDWTRGLAAIIMLQGHTFNSFTRTNLRGGGPYMLSQFAGGLPPAIFLLLTGITFAFLMDSKGREGGTAKTRIWSALKRSRYLFILAFLFRIQMYVTGYPTSPASEILRVDILNCMGFAMLMFSPLAVLTTIARVRVSAIVGCLVAGLAPFVSMFNNPQIPALIRAYVVPDYNYFGFFPWASFLAFGLSLGSILRLLKKEDLERAMLWLMAIGLGVGLLAYYLSNLPYSIYPKSEFWLDSPGLVAIKLSFVMCLLAVAYLWVHVGGSERWSLFRQVGTTSLLVYWVHVELVYGRWFGIWKEAMSVSQVIIYTIVLTVLMTALSVLWTRFKANGSNIRWSRPRTQQVPQAQAVAAD